MELPLITKRAKAFKIIVLASLIVGVLDGLAVITDSFIRFGSEPARVFRYVASGFFGSDAFAGGSRMVLWGLFFHFLIATAWTAFFYTLYVHVDVIRKNVFQAGVLFGFFVWLIMNLVVLPLSNIPEPSGNIFNGWHTLKSILYLVLLLGLPVALIIHGYFTRRLRKANA